MALASIRTGLAMLTSFSSSQSFHSTLHKQPFVDRNYFHSHQTILVLPPYRISTASSIPQQQLKMHLSSLAIFVAVLAPMAVLASPQWHPHGPHGPPGKWHQRPTGPEPSATASIPAGILPPGGFLPTGVSGAGSTGTPKKLDGKKKKVGVSGVAGAGSTGTPKKVAQNSAVVPAPLASASVGVTSYDKK